MPTQVPSELFHFLLIYLSRFTIINMKLGPSLELRHHQEPLEDDEKILNIQLSEEDFEIALNVHADEKEKFLDELNEARVEMTPAQEEIISLANGAVADVLLDYNLNLPREAQDRMCAEIDIVPLNASAYKRITKRDPETKWYELEAGIYIPERNVAILYYKTKAWEGNDDRNDEILHVVSHELFHAKSYRALQAFRDAEKPAEEKPVVEQYRSGLHLLKLGTTEHQMFRALNEAITESLALEATNRCVNEQRDFYGGRIKEQISSELEQARAYATSKFSRINEMKKRWKTWVKSNTIPLDAFGNVRDYKKVKEAFIEHVFADPTYQYEYPNGTYTYERYLLDAFVHAIAKKDSDYAGNKREVRSVFYRAYTSGHMLPLGRLIEKTLGKGTFRLLSKFIALSDTSELSEEEKTTQRTAAAELKERMPECEASGYRSCKMLGFCRSHRLPPTISGWDWLKKWG